MKYLLLFEKESVTLQCYWWHRVIIVLFWISILVVCYFGFTYSYYQTINKRANCTWLFVNSQTNTQPSVQKYEKPSIYLIDQILDEYESKKNDTLNSARRNLLARTKCEEDNPTNYVLYLFISALLTYVYIVLIQIVYFRVVIRTVSYLIYNDYYRITK